MNYGKNENLRLFFILTSQLNYNKENYDVKYTCSFHKTILSSLTCVLIYFINYIELDDCVNNSCSENFVIFPEKCT